MSQGLLSVVRTALVLLSLTVPLAARADQAPTADPSRSRAEAALSNIRALERPGKEGFATIWDGNKYVQCRMTEDGGLRCEAGGALMQPTLNAVLTPDRIARLSTLGWRPDVRFGAYVRTFPASASVAQVAADVLQALTEGYDAQVANLEFSTAWVAREPCPPRNGPGQNLAGMVNDDPAMQSTAVHDCFYVPTVDAQVSSAAATSDALFTRYGARITAEIQRLRVNTGRNLFVIFDAGIGFIQCQEDTAPPGIYCEAQSAYYWPPLSTVLTPDRIAELHTAGYADPGRTANYSRTYPSDAYSDEQIATQIINVLHDAYGYNGVAVLAISTEGSKAEDSRTPCRP